MLAAHWFDLTLSLLAGGLLGYAWAVARKARRALREAELLRAQVLIEAAALRALAREITKMYLDGTVAVPDALRRELGH